jgi:hypothetical protein
MGSQDGVEQAETNRKMEIKRKIKMGKRRVPTLKSIFPLLTECYNYTAK